MQAANDPRRPNKIVRFKPVDPQSAPVSGEDSLPEYMNVLGMLFSMCGLMMRLKWCSFAALLASCISFANTRITDDTKQIVSSFMWAFHISRRHELLTEPSSDRPTMVLGEIRKHVA
ncbi:hypothetical protein FO519_003981 [Halicephalobus sp. NKZ332]|nr:hypothetical protein FO519_003981 [Halicephalobus sp. NKZ332]